MVYLKEWGKNDKFGMVQKSESAKRLGVYLMA